MYSESEAYKRMYLHLFSTYENVINLLSESEYAMDQTISEAIEQMVAAQNECEDIYLACELQEDDFLQQIEDGVMEHFDQIARAEYVRQELEAMENARLDRAREES